MSRYTFDVVVVGGGPAGVAAAIASASSGAKTALIERYGFTGGMATAAGISVYLNFPAGKRNLAGSIYTHFIETLNNAGGAYAINYEGTNIAANPEDIKIVNDILLSSCGVEIFYHMPLNGVEIEDRKITSITALGKSGIRYSFAADVFVDATGDAEVAFLGGLPTSLGRPQDNACQPMTMVFRTGPVDIDRAIRGGAELLQNKYLVWGDGHPDLVRYINQAKKENNWPIPKNCFSLIWSDPRFPEIVAVNGTRIDGFNGADSLEMTQAEISGRRQAQAAVEFMRNYLPGFERVQLLSTGPQIGVRETRHINGQYILTEQDILSCKHFEDEIAEAAYCIDVHLPGSPNTDLRNLPEGQSYGIPYRSLLPLGCDNLLVAGRALSATHVAASSVRVMPICMSTGQAAGLAAAQASLEDKPCSQINITSLKSKLRLEIKGDMNAVISSPQVGSCITSHNKIIEINS